MCEGKAGLLHQGIPSIQPERGLCLESNQTDVDVAKPYSCGSETVVTTSQDTLLPPCPIPGGCGERKIRGLAAQGGFASLQAPKGEGAQPHSFSVGETGLCHLRCWEKMLERPSLAAPPAEAEAAPAQGSSATALAQPGQLRAHNSQHRTISDAQSNPGRSPMPTGPCGSTADLVECQRRADLAKEIQTGPFATG